MAWRSCNVKSLRFISGSMFISTLLCLKGHFVFGILLLVTCFLFVLISSSNLKSKSRPVVTCLLKSFSSFAICLDLLDLISCLSLNFSYFSDNCILSCSVRRLLSLSLSILQMMFFLIVKSLRKSLWYEFFDENLLRFSVERLVKLVFMTGFRETVEGNEIKVFLWEVELSRDSFGLLIKEEIEQLFPIAFKVKPVWEFTSFDIVFYKKLLF
ncbi:unnamed protein product [Blepharisma stoltei]|uniref:Uncharacterized protein n=1 Tax=Blepharisma stoltei TaxID=1481888 RepID=A0AAU9KKC6_9CILI|nr:unnamed protein product [Blepharisma stoltei]